MIRRRTSASSWVVVVIVAFASPAASDDLLVNGDSDAGPGWPWIEDSGSSGYPLIVEPPVLPVPPQSGTYAALLGGDFDVTHTLYQDIAVPETSAGLRLEGFRNISTEETFGVYDLVWVEILDTSGALLESLAQWDNTYATGTWDAFVLPLAGTYAGQAIRVQLQATCDSTNRTLFLFDTLQMISLVPTAVAEQQQTVAETWGQIKTKYR